MSEIFSFTILRQGWESDNEGWIEKQSDGTLRLMTTNMGSKCEMPIEELDDHITETEMSLVGLKKAKNLMAA